MKEVFHKIMSFAMAFVVLCSTMSFTINMHYCGDTLVETSILQSAKGCGMEMEKSSTDSCSVKKKNCCKNEQSLVDGQDELQLNFDTISLEHELFVVAFIQSYTNLFDSSLENVAAFSIDPPPRLVRQLYKLDESYLI